MVHKIYENTPTKKELGIRKWLTYVTLFLAGIILAGDLVTVLYKFLDGQDLTLAFLLKALVVLVVSGAVFGYYLEDIRDRIGTKKRRTWAIAIAIVILIAIILGFRVLGSPKTQRLLRQDNQTIMDLQNLQWQVIKYWQVNGIIPESLPNSNYEYRKIGDLSFELCAEFNQSNIAKGKIGLMSPPTREFTNDTWDHLSGRQCFFRNIDPIMYPTQIKG